MGELILGSRGQKESDFHISIGSEKYNCISFVCVFFRVLFLNKVKEMKTEEHGKVRPHDEIKPYLSRCTHAHRPIASMANFTCVCVYPPSQVQLYDG